VRPLPVDEHIPAIVDRVRSSRALILSASPGAGRTTRVPPALAIDGPVISMRCRRAQRLAADPSTRSI
jgi:ATP-dependent helicase HrpB